MAELIRIPIFPLPNVVFFPETTLPLHIFEARYRAMAADALKGVGRVGMVLLKPGWEPDYEESPEAYGIGSSGRIDHSVRLADGRYNLMLSGENRIRIRRYIQEKPYRIAEVESLHDTLPKDPRPSLTRVKTLVQLYKSLLIQWKKEEISGLEKLLPAQMSTAVNWIATTLPISVYKKQRLLELDSIEERYMAIQNLINDRLEVLSFFNTYRPAAPQDPLKN